MYSSSQVGLVVFRRIERNSMLTFSNEYSFSKTVSVPMKIRSPPPKMLFRSFCSVEYLSSNRVLSDVRYFDCWTAKNQCKR